jgi:hypothetical protein
MSEELETAQRYRSHAEELRIIAEGMEDRLNRWILIGVAKDYDKMASSLEARHRSSIATRTRFHHSLF